MCCVFWAAAPLRKSGTSCTCRKKDGQIKARVKGISEVAVALAKPDPGQEGSWRGAERWGKGVLVSVTVIWDSGEESGRKREDERSFIDAPQVGVTEEQASSQSNSGKHMPPLLT